jgi:large subunit ribosomal protein L35
MPKIKTHRGANKRIKISGSGKPRRSQAYKSHILTKKSKKRKRNLRKPALVSKGEIRAIKALLPYKF